MDLSDAKNWLAKLSGPGLSGIFLFLFKNLSLNLKQLDDRMLNIQNKLKEIEDDLKAIKRILRKEEKCSKH